MSGKYKAVGWNRQKRIYDACLMGILLAFVAAFSGMTLLSNPAVTLETIIIRSTAVAAFLLLHVILCIGPLERLDQRFLPLLYNRRHLGVVMFLLGLVHGIFAVIQFHALGENNPLVSIFTAYKMDYGIFRSTGSAAHFPFEPFGLLALFILFVMAATSHDFWLRILGASFWKSLHILVYVAYGSLIVHVAYGALQYEQSPVLAGMVGVGFVLVFGLHLAAQQKENVVDRRRKSGETNGFVEACGLDEVQDGFGKAVSIDGERKAVFRHGDRIYALSNVCRHQGGPVGEGRILDGCITCPWHGWQYAPDSGVSPPPFHEVIETYPVRIRDGMIFVHPKAHSLEQKTEGALIPGGVS
jgi:nitrite reductase/ring-hydroxylating ferredoxin subunit/DMSO/TMAO reductase YedYZ heme-binding membrane subunit